jgi:hypothetical protein
MRRLLLSIAIALVAGALIAPGSFGFAANFDYFGHVKGQPSANVGFFVKRSDAGHRKVVGFTVSQIPYTCSDAPLWFHRGLERFERVTT